MGDLHSMIVQFVCADEAGCECSPFLRESRLMLEVVASVPKMDSSLATTSTVH